MWAIEAGDELGYGNTDRTEGAVNERLLAAWIGIHDRIGATRADERGMTTAELLGNAALGVFALIVIWAGLRQLGLDVVDWIQSDLLGER